MSGNGKVRVLVADGQSLFREAVQQVLETQVDLEVVVSAEDGVRTVAEAARTRPDVALVEASLPNFDGLRATRLIKERVPECRILVLAEEEDEVMLLRAVEAGATGYLSKASPLTGLVSAARALHRGEAVIPARMLEPLLAQLVRRAQEQTTAIRMLAPLTSREREVLGLLSGGADNGRIAQTLVISPLTARTHVQNILRKLRLHSRLEAAAFVMANSLQSELRPSDAVLR